MALRTALDIVADGVAMNLNPAENPDAPKGRYGWKRPMKPGEKPGDDFLYWYLKVDLGTGEVSIRPNLLTVGEAAVGNDVTDWSVDRHASVPVPIDQGKMQTGEVFAINPLMIASHSVEPWLIQA